MQQGTKMFTVDKFLGINEAADANSELKMGEASVIENFAITDGFNLTTRPGVRRVDFGGERDPGWILASWSGFLGETEYFVICDYDGEQDRIFLYGQGENGGHTLVCRQDGALGLQQRDGQMVKIFAFAGKIYIMSRVNTVMYEGGSFVPAEYYVPLVITGASPAGGGTALENLNMLTNLRRIDFSSDGAAKDYVLPSEAVGVTKIVIDNAEGNVTELGVFDAGNHTFKFNSAPVKGVGNVEFTYTTDESETEKSRLKIAAMQLTECYNGSTDTRLFLAGDGSNLCYYTGVPMSGDLTKLYFPGMNEVAVDMSDSPVTGMIRHYGKLLIFKPDGAYSISYEPVTLPGGDTVAGFYLRSISKSFGNDGMGQVQTVNNYPRTLSRGSIYEWRITSSFYKDERYAKRCSNMVARTLGNADVEKIVTCDDNVNKTYYVFLNDQEGTVLVNRYALTDDGIWTVYRSERFRDIRSACMHGEQMIFCGEKEAFWLDPGAATDAALTAGGEGLQIKAVWESGYQAFGADYQRKFSSQVYVSILPSGHSAMTVTAATDRRDAYMEKMIGTDLFSWKTVTFPTWTFRLRAAPKISRVRLKVKKFVYYKMIFRVEEYGATATVLGYDQQVRFSSMAK